jgi:hypothetical protein
VQRPGTTLVSFGPERVTLIALHGLHWSAVSMLSRNGLQLVEDHQLSIETAAEFSGERRNTQAIYTIFTVLWCSIVYCNVQYILCICYLQSSSTPRKASRPRAARALRPLVATNIYQMWAASRRIHRSGCRELEWDAAPLIQSVSNLPSRSYS